MKKTLLILTVFLLGFKIADAQEKINFIRIGETNPSVSAYVFGSGEQLSGQQFQTDGIVTYKGYQYAVYYNQTRNVCIARRKLPLGGWKEIALPYRNNVNDAHNTISMGICHKDGSIHLSYDHHNDDLHYCYSLAASGSANDPDNMVWEAASFSANTNIMDKAVPNVTYPRFISKPDGNLLFECRFNWSGHGDSYLREYDGDTKIWSMVGCYVQGEDVNANNPLMVNGVIKYNEDACAYINGMTYDHLGRLHVTWVWRDDYGGETNHDFYYSYSDDHGRTWKNGKNEQVAATIKMDPVLNTTSIGCLTQHMRDKIMVEEIAKNRGLINQETQDVDTKGRIFAVNSHIPDDGGTDSNWGSSRTKARLHLRFLKEDGTWVRNLIADDNGNSIRSTARVNLSIDSKNNAFMVANGAGVFAGSPKDDYAKWTKLTEDGKTGYYSEPLVDRPLLRSDGVLSFVYLSADNKIVVTDYLVDNPNALSGAGLRAEYFSDDKFSTLISSENDATVVSGSLPANTKTVRWSGTFETSYAENYTLYLNTTAESSVYIDGVKVLLTRNNQNAREYSFTFAPIASHKHNIVIESKATTSDVFGLEWSSASVTKQALPIAALYASLAHDMSVGDNAEEPQLERKAELGSQLLGAQSITGKNTINVTPFNPKGDYTVVISAKIIASVGCGLVLEGRSATGKGVRISLDETSLNWIAPYSQSKLLTVADNSEEQVYRIAVSNEKAHIYQGEEYIATADVVEIGDINATGEEIMPIPQITDLGLLWAGANNKGAGSPNDYGWDNTVSNVGWNTANGGSGIRFLDVTSGHTYNGANYLGRLLTIRWDGGQGTYSFPVTLDANTSYEFSMLYEWWNNGSANSINVGVSNEKSGADLLAVKSMSTSGKNILQKGTFAFTSKEAGTYYLIFSGQSGVMYGIGDLELKKHTYQPKLTLSKYCDGVSDIRIENVMYEDGAYAPGKPEPEVELDEKEILPQSISADFQVAGLSGAKDIRKFPFDPKGDYSIEIAATIPSAEGRGMDFEVRDEQGLGFRTAQNDTEFSKIAPFAQSQILNSSTSKEQIIRYAVKDNKVYVFQNGEFVTSFVRQTIGDMDEAGTTEKTPYSQTAVNSASNLVSNPEFQATADNGAPEGWTSNGSLGVSGGARVQVKASTTELSAYPDGTKAFVIRFDGSYTWFSNKLTLKADTWYEYSLDLISWGNNTSKTLGFTVSTQETGGGNLIATQQITTPSVRAVGERNIIRFKTDAAGVYYTNFSKTGTLVGTVGITNLCLVEYPLNGVLVGKNYTTGIVPINVRYITVDRGGAFAPVKGAVGISDNENDDIVRLDTRGSILIIESRQDMATVKINDLSGKTIVNKANSKQSFTTELASGVYFVSIVTDRGERIIKKIMMH